MALRMHYSIDCKHLIYRNKVAGGYIDRIERVTCKTCLHDVIRGGGYGKLATDRLLAVRLDDLEAKLIRLKAIPPAPKKVSEMLLWGR